MNKSITLHVGLGVLKQVTSYAVAEALGAACSISLSPVRNGLKSMGWVQQCTALAAGANCIAPIRAPAPGPSCAGQTAARASLLATSLCVRSKVAVWSAGIGTSR